MVVQKSCSDFGLVRGNIEDSEELRYLFVIDKPKNDYEEKNPRIKNPGGNNPGVKIELFLPKKIREETGISVIFTGEKDVFRRRKPILYVDNGNHIMRFWEMRISEFDRNKTLVPGGNILYVGYFDIDKIIQFRNEGMFLENHSLVVDQDIISKI